MRMHAHDASYGTGKTLFLFWDSSLEEVSVYHPQKKQELICLVGKNKREYYRMIYPMAHVYYEKHSKTHAKFRRCLS